MMDMRAGLQVAVPAVIVAAAWQLIPRAAQLPASLAGLQTWGPAMMIVVAAAIGFAFRRGRVLLAAAVLALAYGAYFALLRDAPQGAAARATFVALCVLVPLNLGLLAVLRERGILNAHGVQRFAFIALQIGIAAWFAGQRDLVERAYAPLVGRGLLPGIPIPDLGLAAVALGATACIATWVRNRSPVDLGLAGALAAFAAAAGNIHTAHALPIYTGAGALILAIAVLQDSFRMAFRDALTGLPSRRALEERLAGLGRRYAIAMVDVDHFKSFNDTYGHDVGDQVLKVVASRLARVGGGGTAYRYGGEEFTVLFPSRSVAEALPHLEALRREIEAYEMALRASDRPKKAKAGRKRRSGSRRGAGSVSVTVSMGVAECNARLATPSAVIGAADRALYRAKNKGRNQVSR